MNLVIIHYHLNRGGVTRVIENQLAALDAVLPADASWNVAILYGGRREGWDAGQAGRLRSMRLTLHEIPELEYDHLPATADRGGPAELLMALMVTLGELGFAPADTVIHAHNHSLGKNGALPEVLPILAEDGYALLLEPHDFAEDFRPENYTVVRRLATDGTLYPQAPHVHYAVLNGRDHGILAQCGVPAERLHRLPNPVLGTGDLPARAAVRAKLAERFQVPLDARFVLYPVRCIRRKNVGEVLLLAAVAPPGTVFGLSLAPLNPTETPHYERWKRLAEELRLPCCFEVGGPGGLTFHENLAAADAIVTTSVAEGFGMATLEAWLAGCPLVGRNLPDINADFLATGVRLDGLSPRFDVPVDWVGRDTFRDRFAAAYRRAVSAFGLSAPDDLAQQIDAKIDADQVDFADLTPELQEQVIRMAAGHPARAAELRAGKPWLAGALAA
ncbi:MAG: hypothetical protein U1E05_02720, partial [Patescibacteria group bacterium]|nr:hypothetical protein [Patescibacteria group bacterium]